MPYPSLCQEDDPWCQGEEVDEIEVTLMVADIDGRLVEVYRRVYLIVKLHARDPHVDRHETGGMIDEQMDLPPLMLRHLPDMDIEPYQRRENHGDC